MKPKRTKQIVGICIGILLVFGFPIVAGMLFPYVEPARVVTGMGYNEPLHAEPNPKLTALMWYVNGGSVVAYLILISSIVSFVRAGRAARKP